MMMFLLVECDHINLPPLSVPPVVGALMMGHTSWEWPELTQRRPVSRLGGHPDQEFVRLILEGIQEGFRIGFQKRIEQSIYG